MAPARATLIRFRLWLVFASTPVLFRNSHDLVTKLHHKVDEWIPSWKTMGTDGDKWGPASTSPFQHRKSKLTVTPFRVQANPALNSDYVAITGRLSRSQVPDLSPKLMLVRMADFLSPSWVPCSSQNFFRHLSSGALASWCELFLNIPTLDRSILFPSPLHNAQNNTRK